jgi:hypothetical protein
MDHYKIHEGGNIKVYLKEKVEMIGGSCNASGLCAMGGLGAEFLSFVVTELNPE